MVKDFKTIVESLCAINNINVSVKDIIDDNRSEGYYNFLKTICDVIISLEGDRFWNDSNLTPRNVLVYNNIDTGDIKTILNKYLPTTFNIGGSNISVIYDVKSSFVILHVYKLF